MSILKKIVVIAITLILVACESNSAPEPTQTVLPIATEVLPSNTPSPTTTPQPPTETPLPSQTPTLEIPATLEAGTTIVDGDGTFLVYIPEGFFIMGSKPTGKVGFGVDELETPQRTVKLDAYWIDQTEVSNKQYKACENAGKCNPPPNNHTDFTDSYYDNPEYDDYPVLVFWEDAQKYCTWVNRRLPTEAEWEKAARGTDGQIYPWGNDEHYILEDKSVNYVEMGIGSTTPVNEYIRDISPYGVYNMAGNVQEWVADFFDPYYYKKAPLTNPVKSEPPIKEEMKAWSPAYLDHVVRGSSYRDSNFQARAAFREHGYLPSGFRCARSK